uniref:CCHC-type domain-containing protein n=1 Tax=Amphimedon queenslandica TaxID=400682 RepID=A0A1X7VUB7_AMPQE
MNLVTHRQKLIKLADRSEHGWRVVKEYESDSLAENEDDEKRIVKAEKAAASAAAAKKKKVAVRPAVPNPGRMLAPQQQFKTNWPTRARSFSYQPAGPSSSRPFTSSRPIGPCFRCSEMGHLQSSCPKLAAPQYPQFSCTEVDGWGEHPSESNDTFVDMSARYCEASEHGVETCKFKYEDFRTALDYFEEDAYLFTFDLKSGYHHIDIHVEHQSYLGFQWKDQFYVFTVLPFGLSTACYIFTKVLRPVVKHIRALGIRLVLYLDDGLVSVKASETHSISVSRLVEEIITKAGLVINREKSKFTPSKQAAWLGFDIDLALGEIRVSRDKLHTLKILLHSINEETLIPVRVIASIVGKIISMSLVLGDIARLRTRCLYSVILSRSSWSDHVMIMPEARDELSFRVNNIDSFNGRKVWRAPAAVPVVYSDASDTGFGSYTVAHGDDIAHGQWTPLESHKSSTWRELRAVTLTLGAFAPRLSDHRVRWFSDN